MKTISSKQKSAILPSNIYIYMINKSIIKIRNFRKVQAQYIKIHYHNPPNSHTISNKVHGGHIQN